MYVEDQTQVLQTNLATTEKRYPHGRCRIQAQFYLQIGGFTANRPQAILGLRYRHILVTLLHPLGAELACLPGTQAAMLAYVLTCTLYLLRECPEPLYPTDFPKI
jgi:hypothetical protein